MILCQPTEFSHTPLSTQWRGVGGEAQKLLRVMKLTAIILLSACLTASAKGFTQSVTLNEKNAPLQKVFKEIKRQTGYNFLYTLEQLDQAGKVDVQLRNATLEEALTVCLMGKQLTYTIVEKTVVIKRKEITPLPPLSGLDSQGPEGAIDVKGRVVNEKGEPVEGVTVTIKGTKTVTTTNANGEFSINSLDKDAVLVFTHVSMETFELKVSGKTDLAISLKPKISALGDVQIIANTGYQQVKPNEITGSLTVVDNKTINQQVGSNILNRLDGVASGVFFPKQSLQDGPKIMIRGLSTINGPKDPLIVVDNFPYNGDINNINPNDVESITVLKDAAATAIWGSLRGANGVIVITTKKGKFNQPLKVALNTNVIATNKTNLSSLRIISSDDYINLEQDLFNQGYYDSYLNDTWSRPAVTPVVEILDKLRSGAISSSDAANQIGFYRNIDIRDQFSKYFYQKSITQQYAINVTGGSNNMNYYLSAGYDRNEDQLSAIFDRYTFRSKNTYKPIKNLELSLDFQYTQQNTKSGKSGYGEIRVGQWQTPYLSFGANNGNPSTVANFYRQSYIDTAGGGKLLDWSYYPLEDWKHNRTKANQQDFLSNIGVRYTIFKGFSIDIKYSYERQNLNQEHLQDLQSFYARDIINRFSEIDPFSGTVNYIVPLGSILGVTNGVLESQKLRGQINYDNSWKKHNISAIAGGELNQTHTTGDNNILFGYNENTLAASNVDLVNPYPNFINGSYGYIPGGASLTDQLSRFVSIYALGAYTYSKKYTFSVSGRRDASNLFGVSTNNKWNPLWSAGVGWDISNESFYKSSCFTFLKLRATYGFTGNADPRRSGVTTLVLNSGIPPTNFPISRVDQFANPELRWEKVKTINIGLDFQTKHQVLSGSIEYYYKRGIDLLGNAPVDPTAGLNGMSTLIKNVASMEGNGIDVTINSKNIDNDFKWNTSFLFNWNTSKTTDYYLDSNLRSGSFISDGSIINPVVGQPLYSIVAFKWAGLDVNGNPQGYWDKQVSTDYDNIFLNTRKEELIYKSALPTVFGSLINTFTYKGFSLSANIGYRLGYYFKKPTLYYSALFNNGSVIGTADYSKRWKNPGDERTTNVPSMVYPANNNRDAFYSNSEINTLKADNIRLHYINLGYDITKDTWKKIPLQSIQLYVNASNLGIIWKANNENIDPDFISTPQGGKTFAIGLRANF